MYDVTMSMTISAKPKHRLAVIAPLCAGGMIVLEGNAAHYLTAVLRLGMGDRLSVFNRTDGEWVAAITEIKKRALTLSVVALLRPPAANAMELTICFAPIKGGRLETIIEKATELGATVLQPVITQRTIVDKVNIERAETIAREAAEQCERLDWPVVHPPVKLEKLLGDWPVDLPLIYGDESGASGSIIDLMGASPPNPLAVAARAVKRYASTPQPSAELPCSSNPLATHGYDSRLKGMSEPDERVISAEQIRKWAILVGPEGGFTPDEFAMLTRVKAARGVGLGPRILRADTAVITLAALTLAAWGDWHHAPRFTFGA